MKVTFLGTGTMGAPMARNAAKAGIDKDMAATLLGITGEDDN